MSHDRGRKEIYTVKYFIRALNTMNKPVFQGFTLRKQLLPFYTVRAGSAGQTSVKNCVLLCTKVLKSLRVQRRRGQRERQTRPASRWTSGVFLPPRRSRRSTCSQSRTTRQRKKERKRNHCLPKIIARPVFYRAAAPAVIIEWEIFKCVSLPGDAI